MRFNEDDLLNYKNTIGAIGMKPERAVTVLESMITDTPEWIKNDPDNENEMAFAKYLVDNKELFLSI